jgi:hypothetical protein
MLFMPLAAFTRAMPFLRGWHSIFDDIIPTPGTLLFCHFLTVKLFVLATG